MSDPGDGGDKAKQAASAALNKGKKKAVQALVKKVGAKVLMIIGGWTALIVIVVTLMIFLIVGDLISPPPAEALDGTCSAGGTYKPNAPSEYGPNPTVINIIYQVAQQKHADARATLALFEAVDDESDFKNLANSKVPGSENTPLGFDKYLPGQPDGNDGLSVGILQQQVGMGWGTLNEMMDPAHAAGIFLDRAIAAEHIPGSAAQLAQYVQQSGTPDGSNYAAHQADAQAKLTQAQSGTVGATGVSCQVGSLLVVGGHVTFTSHGADVKCGPESSSMSVIKVQMDLPKGQAGQAMLAEANMIEKGFCYAWGGGGGGPAYVSSGYPHGGPTVVVNPNGQKVNGFDCSGLQQYAVYIGTGYKVLIPRTTETEFSSSTLQPVSVAQLTPGDLVFYDGASPGHVTMYLGKFKMVNGTLTSDPNGTPYVGQASTFGQPANVSPMNNPGWMPVGYRHPAYQGSVAVV